MSRILLVEDDLEFGEMVQEWLTLEQHAVEWVDDGQHASEQLIASHYDVVILDWDLPKMSGLDVCRSYRSAGGHTPIIMLTGRGSLDDKEQGFDVGADDYLVKPFHFRELSSRIKALLRRSSAGPPKAHPGNANQRYSARNLCETCGGYFAEDRSTCPTDGTRLVSTQVKIDDLVGTTIGDRYDVLALIGTGGMAVVYQAWHKFLNRLVAVKLLHTRYLDDPVHLKRFHLEARSVSTLKHPSIISMLDFGMMGTEPYLVMEFVNGLSLTDILRQESRLDAGRAVHISAQVCDGIGYAHANGIIHRDLKPSNLMLEKKADGSEAVRVVDFGIAKLLPHGDEGGEHLTETGECLGTSSYMSPEQCRGQQLDARSDIYALGCIMYEMLTGQCPFVGRNSLDTMLNQINSPATPLSAVRTDLTIPRELERIVLMTLEKDPARRHQSMAELRRDLDTVLR